MKIFNENGRQNYNKGDSAKAFLWGGIIIPIFVSLCATFVLTFLASAFGMALNDFLEVKAVLIFTILIAQISFVIWLIYHNRKQNINPIKAMKFQKIDWRIAIIVAVLGVAMLFLINNFVTLVDAGLAGLGYVKDNEVPLAVDSVTNLIIGLFVMAIIPAFVEESMFRGVILGGLLDKAKSKKQIILAILVSAIIFALIHGSLQQFVYPIIMGIVFGTVFFVTGNIWYSIILHTFSNGTVVVMNYVYSVVGTVDTPTIINAEFVLVAIIGLVLAVGLFALAIWVIRKMVAKKSPAPAEITTDENVVISEDGTVLNTSSEVDEKLKEYSERTQSVFGNYNFKNLPNIALWLAFGISVLTLILDFITTIMPK